MPTESLLRYWKLQGPDGQLATCELVRTPTGLEVRCDWTAEGAEARGARTAPIAVMAEALGVADAWKAAYVEKGWAKYKN